MDKKKLEAFKKRLETRQQDLRRTVSRTQADGRSADEDTAQDIADRAASSYTKEFLFSQSNNERQLLQMVEKALARNAGLGWIGKHTNLIDRNAGSYFFLGEIYLDLKLPVDAASSAHCGTCSACMPACPTGAIVAPYRLDARRCISYLTIELTGTIPVEFRRAIGNRIFGCDDCQLVCPWNKFARPTAEKDFAIRHGLDQARLTDLFAWTELEFLEKTRGSPIRRIGHERWLRNIAVALGNAPTAPEIIAALSRRARHPSPLVREHVQWALAQHGSTPAGDAAK